MLLLLILILKLYGENKKLKINYIFLKDTYKTSFFDEMKNEKRKKNEKKKTLNWQR